MTKFKRCSKGFPCGKTCISRKRQCWKNLSTENSKVAETFSQFVNRLVGVKMKPLSEYNEEINKLAESLVKNFSEETLDKIDSLTKEVYDNYVEPIKTKFKEKYGINREAANSLASKMMGEYSENPEYSHYKEILINTLEVVGSSERLESTKISFSTEKPSSYDYLLRKINFNKYDNYRNVVPHEISHDLELREDNLDSLYKERGAVFDFDFSNGYKSILMDNSEVISPYSRRAYLDPDSNKVIATEMVSTLFEVIMNRERFSINSLVNKNGEIKEQFKLVMELFL